MNLRPSAWLAQARNDLELAELASRNGFLAQACYFASQAAEKALKSAILELGEEPPHTHVLGDLVRRLEAAGLDASVFARMPLKSLSRMSSARDTRSMPPHLRNCLTQPMLSRPSAQHGR